MKVCKFYYYTRNYDFAKMYVDELNKHVFKDVRSYWLEPSGYNKEVYAIVCRYRVFGKSDAYIVGKIIRWLIKIAEKLYTL